MQSKKCFTGLLKMAVSDDVQLGVQTRSSYDVKNRGSDGSESRTVLEKKQEVLSTIVL